MSATSRSGGRSSKTASDHWLSVLVIVWHSARARFSASLSALDGLDTPTLCCEDLTRMRSAITQVVAGSAGRAGHARGAPRLLLSGMHECSAAVDGRPVDGSVLNSRSGCRS